MLLTCYTIVNRLFSDINVSQGSAATYARYDGIFNNDYTGYCKLTNESYSDFFKSVKI